MGDILFAPGLVIANWKKTKKMKRKNLSTVHYTAAPPPPRKKIKKTNVLFEYMCVSLEVLMCVDLCYTCRYTMRFLIIQRESISTDNDFLSRGISGFECLGMFDVLN